MFIHIALLSLRHAFSFYAIQKECEACIASHKGGWDKNIPPGLKCTFNRATTLCDEQPVPPPSPTPVPCSTAEDCSLLGRCNNGVCECKKGWTGRVCSKGDFAPLDVTLGYHNATQASWGGRPVTLHPHPLIPSCFFFFFGLTQKHCMEVQCPDPTPYAGASKVPPSQCSIASYFCHCMLTCAIPMAHQISSGQSKIQSPANGS